jgi:hypothetical protein
MAHGKAICPRKVSVGVTLRPLSNSSPCAVWYFPSWRGTASRLPFLGRRARTSGAVSIVRIPSYLRHDPKILKIPFAEDRDVRLALTISQFDTLNQNQRRSTEATPP